MKKLVKTNTNRKDSVEAYACSCNCVCACTNSNIRVTQAVRNSATRNSDVSNFNFK